VAEDLTSIGFVAEGELAANADEALEIGKRLSKGIMLAKDIVNSPHNALNSLSLADTAKRIAAESDGLITCQILDKVECEKRGMGAYLGVARGSETEPGNRV
jgi:leucyl aminopeptidase